MGRYICQIAPTKNVQVTSQNWHLDIDTRYVIYLVSVTIVYPYGYHFLSHKSCQFPFGVELWVAPLFPFI